MAKINTAGLAQLQFGGIELSDEALVKTLTTMASQHDELNRLNPSDVGSVLSRGQVAEGVTAGSKDCEPPSYETSDMFREVEIPKAWAGETTSQGITLERAEFEAEKRRYETRVADSLDKLNVAIDALGLIVGDLAGAELQRALTQKASGKTSRRRAGLAQAAKASRNVTARVRGR